MDIRLREHRRGRRSVPRHVLGLRGHFLEELGAHVLVGILQLDLFRDGDAVVRDRRRAEFLVENDVSSPGSQRHPDGVRQLVHAALERVTRRGVELQLLCHGSLLLLASPAPFSGGAGLAESCVGTIPNRVLIVLTLYDAGLGAQPPSWGVAPPRYLRGLLRLGAAFRAARDAADAAFGAASRGTCFAISRAPLAPRRFNS